MVTIDKRELTNEELDTLIEEIRLTPNISGYTKKAWHSFGPLYVATIDDELAGVQTVSDIGSTWSALAILFVRETFRGQNIGHQLFEKGWQELEGRHRNIYVTSRNPIVLKWMKDKGMQFVPAHRLPWAVIWDELACKPNLYRITEVYRKKRIFPNQPPFQYGIKKLTR